MATIYEFIARDNQSNKKMTVDPNTGEVINSESVSKTGAVGEKEHFYFTGSNKGVDHNRYMRAINPLLNRYIPGMEKIVRVGRAGMGIADTMATQGITEALKSVGSIVLLQLLLTTIDNAYRKMKEDIKEENTSNYAKLITGQSQVSQNSKATIDLFGKISYKDQ